LNQGVREMEIMTPDSSRWKEFADRLEGEEGCNFVEKENGSITWNCSGSEERPLARAILEKMGDVDIDATMQYFDEHGGFCDCEILFNIDPCDDEV